MSTDAGIPATTWETSSGVLGPLPRLSARQVALERRLRPAADPANLARWIDWLQEPIGPLLALGAPEVVPRASGLGKPGLTAQITWPARGARLGLGVETPLIHALIDRLLGFTRQPGEERLPATPIERGLMAYLLARGLSAAGAAPGLILDRLGPEPFPVEGLGPVVTIRWPAAVGALAGSVRLWLPEGLVDALPARRLVPETVPKRAEGLGALWKACAAEAVLPRGPGWLRSGGVLPLRGAALRGTVASPAGAIELTTRTEDHRFVFPAEAVPGSGGARLRLTAPLCCEPVPREAIPVSVPSESAPAPTEVPVTLTVELGRVTIPLHRLADLKPGDVVELGRHAREPVELTSNGRLVARGELVQIDTELGVRVTNVLL